MRHFHEPFNPTFPPPGSRFRTTHHFERLTLPRDHARLQMIDALLGGGVQLPSVRGRDFRKPNQLAARLLRSLRMAAQARPTRVVLKDPLAAFSSDVLRRQLDMRAVVIVRAPEAVVASFVARDWNFRPLHFRNQPAIWHDLLDADEREHFDRFEHLPGREGVLLRVAWMWRCINRILQRFCSDDAAWTVVRHESFLESGDAMAESLFRRLDLDFGEPERAFLRETQSEEHVARTSAVRKVLDVQVSLSDLRASTGKRLTADEIALVRGICEETHRAWTPCFLPCRTPDE